MRLVAALATAVVAAGCGFLPGAVPEWVVNRQPLESCGEESPGGMNEDARACLLEAYEAGRGAELISTQTTIEGDPVTRYIRVHENGVIEVFVDATRDQYASGTWSRLTCDRLIPVAEANDPPDLVLPDAMVFIEEGCEELPVP